MTMMLKGHNGTEFELGVSREAFAEMQDTGGSRFATINFRAATADDSWEETAPCLNLFELKNLAEWLETVGQPDASEGDPGRHGGEGDTPVLELLQPELVFAITGGHGDAVTMRIGFHLENREDIFQTDSPTEEADAIDLHVDRRTVLAAAEALRRDLEGLPMDGNEKDAIDGDDEDGMLGAVDEDLNIIDNEKPYPPGAGEGEDNAGER
jgi:hypothetical protein